MSDYDFYAGVAENTKYMLDRMQLYVDMVLKNGDSIHQEKPGQLIINIRKPPKDKPDVVKDK